MQHIRAAVLDFSIIAKRGKAIEPQLTKLLQTKRAVSIAEAKTLTLILPSVELQLFVHGQEEEAVKVCTLLGRFQCFQDLNPVWEDITSIPFDYEIQLHPASDTLSKVFHEHRQGELLVGNWSYKLGIKVIRTKAVDQLDLTKLTYESVGQLNWQIIPPVIPVAMNNDGTVRGQLPQDIINRELLINTEDV